MSSCPACPPATTHPELAPPPAATCSTRSAGWCSWRAACRRRRAWGSCCLRLQSCAATRCARCARRAASCGPLVPAASCLRLSVRRQRRRSCCLRHSLSDRCTSPPCPSSCQVWSVRQDCASELAALAQHLPHEAVSERLLPLWQSLLSDVSAWVQAAAKRQAGPLLASVDPEHCPEGATGRWHSRLPLLQRCVRLPGWPPCSYASQPMALPGTPQHRSPAHLPAFPCSAARVLPSGGLGPCHPHRGVRPLPACRAG